MKNPKTQRVFIRISSDELNQVVDNAQSAGLSLSAYARMRMLNRPVQTRPPDEYRAILRNISGLCNNVNQIARAVHMQCVHPVRAAEEAKRIAQEIYTVVKERNSDNGV